MVATSDLRAIAADIKAKVRKALEQTGEQSRIIASQTTAFGGRRLKNSVKWRYLSTYTIRVHTGIKHASFIEGGTRPHIIQPKKARVLSFKVGGRKVVTRLVRHPGTKATHWLENATNQAFDKATQDLQRALDSANY